jgi:hypothetical protein
MTGDDDKPLGARLEDLLRRQAAGRDAPAWITDLVAGRAEGTKIDERGDARVVATRADGGWCEIEIRLTFPTPAPVGKRFWKPEGRGMPRSGFASLSYIVVDEIVQNDADISATSWPRVDERGRLVFTDEPARYVRTDVRELAEFLQATDLRPRGRSTAIRMGTTLAAVVRTDKLTRADDKPVSPGKWLVPPIYDISDAARNKAKAAFFAAVTPTLSPEQVRKIRKEAESR